MHESPKETTDKIMNAVRNTLNKSEFKLFIIKMFGKKESVIDIHGTEVILSLYKGKYYLIDYVGNKDE